MLSPPILLQILLDGLVRGSAYGLMGMGMALAFGIIGVVNLAHGAFFMLGCYAMYAAAVRFGLPAWLALVCAAGALFVAGLAIERAILAPLRRHHGERWLTDGYVLTIGIMIVLQSLALILFGPFDHGVASLWRGRLFFGPVVLSKDRLLVLMGAAVTTALLAAFLRLTAAGRSIRAVGQMPAAAAVLGINVQGVYAVTFGISAALAGVAGGLLLPTYPASPLVGGDILLKAFVVVVVGGLGSTAGAMAAGLLLGVLEAFATVMASGGWQNSLSALLVLLVLALRPNGLFASSSTRP